MNKTKSKVMCFLQEYVHLLWVTVTVTLSVAEFPLSSRTVNEKTYWPLVRAVALATDSLKLIMLELVGPERHRQVYATILWSSCDAEPFRMVHVWGSDMNCNYYGRSCRLWVEKRFVVIMIIWTKIAVMANICYVVMSVTSIFIRRRSIIYIEKNIAYLTYDR